MCADLVLVIYARWADAVEMQTRTGQTIVIAAGPAASDRAVQREMRILP